MNEENNNIKLKSMMKISEMISYLKTKNIKFELISEEKAEKYLRDNNNYYNLTSYKNNFVKYPTPAGKFEGMYQDLDFAYLKDLSIIDHRVRLILFKMIIDIEHYLKIRILNIVENIDEEDGYRAVNLYLEKDFNDKKRVHNSIFKKVGSEYYEKIFSNYDLDEDKKLENIPIWEFLEIITFGELISFYEFFSKKYNLIDENENIFILREVGKLRNAVAHNSCVLSELNKKDNPYPPDHKITQFLKECGIEKEMRKNKLSNSRIRQITYTLYMFNKIVTSEGIKKNIRTDINELFFERIIYHKEYYNNNELLKSIYFYFKSILEKKYSEFVNQ